MWIGVFGILSLCQSLSAVRILAYFPIAAKSHHHIFQPLIWELANRGHVITYVSPFGMENQHQNISHIETDDFKAVFSNVGGNSMTSMTPFTAALFYARLMVPMCEKMCLSSPIQEVFHSDQSYDMVLHEALFFQEHVHAFIYKFKAIGVGVYPFGDVTWVNEMSGLPSNPAYMMGFQMPLSDRMQFFERLLATTIQWVGTLVSYYYLQELQTVVDQCFNYGDIDTRPSLSRLASDQALILVGSHHAVGYSFPKAPHVKEIGGISIKEETSLPGDLESFLNNSKHGVIYVSFGSLLRTELPKYRNFRKHLLDSFGKLKEDVLFKNNDDSMEGITENVKIAKWFPQQDLLAHKNLKLFVSHGGFQSMVETINYGVPVVIIPFFGDQYKNAKLAKTSGFGIGIEFNNVSEQSITWAVRETIDNPRYKQEAQRRSVILKDRPMKPLDEAIYWIEYVQRHGNILQPASAQMSLVQVNLFDVYSVIAGIVLVSFIMLRNLIRWVVARMSLLNVRLSNTKKLN